MPRIPTPTVARSLRGIDVDDADDDELSEDELLRFVDDALGEALAAHMELPVTLNRCTVLTYTMMRSGRGYELKFEAPLSEGPKLIALAMALQRMVSLTVERYTKPAT